MNKKYFGIKITEANKDVINKFLLKYGIDNMAFADYMFFSFHRFKFGYSFDKCILHDNKIRQADILLKNAQEFMTWFKYYLKYLELPKL